MAAISLARKRPRPAVLPTASQEILAIDIARKFAKSDYFGLVYVNETHNLISL
jgi:hypothetical protein